MISLFPQDTYKGRKGGMRRDIAEALEEMKNIAKTNTSVSNYIKKQ